MKLVTVAGPPSSGKTSVLTKVIRHILDEGKAVGVAKFDCLSTEDEKAYEAMGIPVQKGLARELCPDHYFITNIEEVFTWGEEQGLDYLFTESAGLCNRCSPHIRSIPAICVVDQLSGINTPVKIGPMLRMADVVVITKSDIVSQAEREVFERKVQFANPRAVVCHVNGLSGQGAFELYRQIAGMDAREQVTGNALRFPMPMALCSYCLGETKIGKEYQVGNVRKMQWNK